MSSEDTPTEIGSVEDEASGWVGPYKLLQKLGEGGMGTVYMAEQEQPVRRTVALKVIKPGMDSRQVIARFEAERQAVALMNHQNIARVLDAGTTDDQRPYFVMELVKGVPITQYCDNNRLTLEDRLQLFVQVCNAIQHAHQKGIIHRDIKPTNILVTLYDGKPVPKVIDFGLAKALEQRLTERTMYTQFGQVVGTLEYMSPEQAEMNAVDVDTRTDVYSLGVLMYELLTGTTPLKKQTLREQAFDRVLQIIREEDPPKPSTRLSESGDAIAGISNQRRLDPNRLSQSLRGDLDWIVMTALDKDRQRRYQTAADFGQDIGRFLAHEPIQARPPSTMYRMRKLVRRNMAAFVTAVAFVGLLVAGIITTTVLAYNAHDARELAESRLKSEKTARQESDKLRIEEARQREIAEEQRDKAVAAEKRARKAEELAKSEANVAATVSDLMKNQLDTRAEPEEDTFAPQALLTYAQRFLNTPEAKSVQTALNLTGGTAPIAATAIASAARSLSMLRETENNLESLAESQRTRLAQDDSPANRSSLATYLTLLANLYLRDQRPQEAAKVAAESIELRSQDQPDDWRVFETKSILGEALTNLKTYQMAEVELLAGYNGLEQRKDRIPEAARRKRLMDAAQRLMEHYGLRVDAVRMLKWQTIADSLRQDSKEN